MKKLLIAASLVALVFSACSKEALVSEAPKCNKGLDLEAILTPEVKAAIQEDGKVFWSEGDRISITDENNNVDIYELSSGAGTASANFKLVGETSTITGTNITAYYPATIDNDSKVIPSSQTYSSTSSLNGAIMKADAVVSGTRATLAFKNIGSIIKFVFKGDATVRTINVTADKPLSGAFTVTDDVAGITDSPSAVYKSGINLECGTGVALTASGTPFYVALPAGAYTDVRLSVVTSDGKIKFLKTSSLTASVNTVKTITIPLSDFETPTDLSDEAGETANCYIVSAAGTYSIDADIKGNGVLSGNTVLAAEGENPAISGQATAELVWETQNTKTAPSLNSVIKDAVYSDGKIIFRTPTIFTEGNALVAVKDCKGEILWSWHLWCTDAPSYVTLNEDTSVKIMDRVLGALGVANGSTTTYGLRYQWGRKDPMISNYDEYKFTRDFVLSGITNAIASGTGTNSLAYSIKHPLVKITSPADETLPANSWNWFVPNQTNCGIKPNYLWGSSNGNTKTMYDPCPPGWRTHGTITANGKNWESLFAAFGKFGKSPNIITPVPSFVSFNDDGYLTISSDIVTPALNINYVEGMNGTFLSYNGTSSFCYQYVKKDGMYIIYGSISKSSAYPILPIKDTSAY